MRFFVFSLLCFDKNIQLFPDKKNRKNLTFPQIRVIIMVYMHFCRITIIIRFAALSGVREKKYET